MQPPVQAAKVVFSSNLMVEPWIRRDGTFVGVLASRRLDETKPLRAVRLSCERGREWGLWRGHGSGLRGRRGHSRGDRRHGGRRPRMAEAAVAVDELLAGVMLAITLVHVAVMAEMLRRLGRRLVLAILAHGRPAELERQQEREQNCQEPFHGVNYRLSELSACAEPVRGLAAGQPGWAAA